MRHFWVVTFTSSMWNGNLLNSLGWTIVIFFAFHWSKVMCEVKLRLKAKRVGPYYAHSVFQALFLPSSRISKEENWIIASPFCSVSVILSFEEMERGQLKWCLSVNITLAWIFLAVQGASKILKLRWFPNICTFCGAMMKWSILEKVTLPIQLEIFVCATSLHLQN